MVTLALDEGGGYTWSRASALFIKMAGRKLTFGVQVPLDHAKEDYSYSRGGGIAQDTGRTSDGAHWHVMAEACQNNAVPRIARAHALHQRLVGQNAEGIVRGLRTPVFHLLSSWRIMGIGSAHI
eukprot:6466657-Amphidinium_carterae.1